MLYGAKVFLRPLEESDLPAMLKWRNDPEVGKYVLPGVPFPMPMAKEKEWLRDLQNDAARKIFAICDQATKKQIGSVGISNISQRDHAGFFSILIGEKDYWGHGYGTEAIVLFLGYCFRILNLRRIVLEVYAYNERAIKCYEKVGFVKEGLARRSVYKDGKYVDEYWMAMFQDDYLARYPEAGRVK